MKISVVIPALNEEGSIHRVIEDIPGYVNDIIVADNGSVDDTAEIARKAGGKVVSEKRRGYGHACTTGVAAAGSPDIIVFLDGDYSDYPEDMTLLVDPIVKDGYDFVVSSRIKKREKGALPIHAVIANLFFGFMIQMLYGVKFTDLGPLRAIKYDKFQELSMRHMTYGWTAEMQVKAAKREFKIKEVDVRYRKRIGKSKVTGSVKVSMKAALTIFWTILRP